MEKQLFIVTLEVPPPFSSNFPKMDAERMTNIIRDAMRARTWSFNGWVPFKITVTKDGKEVSASGEIPEHVLSKFGYLSEEMTVSPAPEEETCTVKMRLW